MFLKGVYQFAILYSDIFSRSPQIWSSISKTANIFWNFLGSTYWLQSIQKNDTRNFCLFVYLRSYNDKSKFSFLETVQSSRNTLIWERAIFAQNVSINIPLHIGKNPVEKLCKVLEMELKTCNPVGLKFVFDKIKFKVLHYIQHDFIRQGPGLSKDQISMFKSFVINYFILKYRHTF